MSEEGSKRKQKIEMLPRFSLHACFSRCVFRRKRQAQLLDRCSRRLGEAEDAAGLREKKQSAALNQKRKTSTGAFLCVSREKRDFLFSFLSRFKDTLFSKSKKTNQEKNTGKSGAELTLFFAPRV